MKIIIIDNKEDKVLLLADLVKEAFPHALIYPENERRTFSDWESVFTYLKTFPDEQIILCTDLTLTQENYQDALRGLESGRLIRAMRKDWILLTYTHFGRRIESESAFKEAFNGIIEKGDISKQLDRAGRVSYVKDVIESALRKPQYGKTEYILRSIEFPPEYYHSGITILSYFTDILRHKNLSEKVKVSIEQSGLNVRLIIESPSGQRESIERTLETYALVVSGKRPVEELTTDPYEVLELKSQLRIAHAQLQNERDMLALRSSEVTELRSDIEETRASLRQMGRKSEAEASRFMALIEGLVEHNTNLSTSFRELTEQAAKFQNKALTGALENLYKVIERGVREEDQEEVIRNLTTIQQQNPGILRRISEILVPGAISGVAGNYLYAWLQFFIGSLPK